MLKVSQGAGQASRDAFYWRNGPCCAGCDWWAAHSSSTGDCTRSAPVSAADRVAMLGMTSISFNPGAGHVVTPRGHVCGDFKDEFDWTTLPLAYRKAVGCNLRALGSQNDG